MAVNTPWTCGSFCQQIIGSCPTADKFPISPGVKTKRFFIIVDDSVVALIIMHISFLFYSYLQFALQITAWPLSIAIRTRCVL